MIKRFARILCILLALLPLFASAEYNPFEYVNRMSMWAIWR